MHTTFQLGLLYFIHLLIDADGVTHAKELEALESIRERQNILDSIFHQFEIEIAGLDELSVYCRGVELVNQCSLEEKLTIFCLLYRLSEVDGRVHAKEIRLLLYSLKDAGITFDEVVTRAQTLKSLFE